MPVYLRYLGAEAFGLVGFFTTMQIWLSLLDLGMTPTLSRQMACYKANTLSAHALRELLRTLEWIFSSLALLTVLTGLLASPWLASNWLKLDKLQPSVVSTCIAMMAFASGLRWLAGLYRSGLIGMERQTLVNGISSSVATLKFVGILPLLIFISTEPTVFFGYQVVLAICEALVYLLLLHRNLTPANVSIWPSFKALRSVLPFAGSIAFIGVTWVLIMNLDKLLLSHFLSLRDYGYFSLAIVVAGGIILLISPISQVLQPRLTILLSQKKNTEATELFREASQFISGLMAAVSLIAAVFAKPLLLTWTGDSEASQIAAPILFWYALGNGVVGMLTMPYIIQYATGRLRLHVIGNILFGIFFIPAIAYASWAFGPKGAGITWFTSNLIFLMIWIPVVFRQYLKGIFLKWLVKDVLVLWLAASLPVLIAAIFLNYPESRVKMLAFIVTVGVLSLMFGWLAGDRIRVQLVNMVIRMGSSSKRIIERH